MYRTVIVPLDGSARSQAALPVAARLARRCGADLELARVHIDDRPDLADDPSWDAMFREGEQRHLESLAAAYADLAGRPVRTALLDPPVVDALCDLASARAAPLIVVAGRGRTGLRRALLGSTADGLVRHSHAPVLVLRDRSPADEPASWRSRASFARIVCPVDGTPFAEGGIPHAVTMARATGATLHLIRIIGPVMTSAVFGALAMHPVAVDGATIEQNDRAADYLERIAERILVSAPDCNVTTEVALSTNAAAAIIDASRRQLADLVVMASHGRGASRLLVGAVGDRILRDGPDAVLFVRPPRIFSSPKRQKPCASRESLASGPFLPA